MSHPVPDQFLCVYAIRSTNWTNRATLWCPKLTHVGSQKRYTEQRRKSFYTILLLFLFFYFSIYIYMSPKLRYILYCLISNSIASAYNWPQTSPIMCELEFRLVHACYPCRERERGGAGGWSVLNSDILRSKVGNLLGPSHERKISCGSFCSWHVWSAFHHTKEENSQGA